MLAQALVDESYEEVNRSYFLRALLEIIIAGELLIILAYLLAYRLYPMAVRDAWWGLRDASWWWGIRSMPLSGDEVDGEAAAEAVQKQGKSVVSARSSAAAAAAADEETAAVVAAAAGDDGAARAAPNEEAPAPFQAGVQHGDGRAHYRCAYHAATPWPLRRLLAAPPRVFGYEGEVDAQARPHGHGEWRDSSHGGERLRGVWRHGVPVGPFSATENNTGFAVKAVRIAYCHNRRAPGVSSKDSSAASRACAGASGAPGLWWGVVAVECSVAGHFFRNLPAIASHVSGPARGRDAAWCIAQLDSIDPLYRQRSLRPESLLITTRIAADGRRVVHVAGQLPDDREGGREDTSASAAAAATDSVTTASTTAIALVAATPSDQLLTIRLCHDRPLSQDSTPRCCSADAVPTPHPSSLAAETEAVKTLQQQQTPPPPPPDAPNDHADKGGASDAGDKVSQKAAAATAATACAERASSPVPPVSSPRAWLHVDGWCSATSRSTEAVVFIGGFNSTVSDSMLRLGQLWTLGDFPAHLSPFVFGWPTGREASYLQVRAMAGSSAMADDLAAFVASLVAGGVRHLHIIAHSLGAHMLLRGLSALTGLLQPAGGAGTVTATGGGAAPTVITDGVTASGGGAGDKITLATCVLMNPDTPLDNFVHEDFPRLRRLCDHVTMYADQYDYALWLSELLGGVGRVLGKHPFELGELDMDVIDTTWVDVGVDQMRHNFAANQLLVDDLRRIIFTQERARSRTERMTHRSSNVWAFIGAPRFFTTDLI